MTLTSEDKDLARKFADLLINGLGPKNWRNPKAWTPDRENRIKAKINRSMANYPEDTKAAALEAGKSFWQAATK